MSEQPRSGYEIMQELNRRSRGQWRPSPGSVYPALQQLEDEGLVRNNAASGGGRSFQLTEQGSAHVAEHAEEMGSPWTAMAESVDDDVVGLHNLVGQVAMAAMQVAHTGSEEQVKKAAKLLAKARRELYHLLADGDPDDKEP